MAELAAEVSKHRTKGSGANFIDMTGKKVGRWLVLRRTEQLKKVRWVCKCECGTERDVSGVDLRSGKTNSCGCLTRDLRKVRSAASIRRNYSREHNSWAAMKQRCYYPKHIEYHRYGGRGITICAGWCDSFANFLADMGKCPEGHSLDRIDIDGNYEPSNCRWVTFQQQMLNTSRTVFVEYNGQRMALIELARTLGVKYEKLHHWYRDKGLSLDLAISRTLSTRRTCRSVSQLA